MKKFFILFLSILLISTFAYAQEVTLYGYSEIEVRSEFLKDEDGVYSNTLGPISLDYWNTYFKVKAEPSSWLESYFELKMYPDFSNLFGPGIIEVQKAHLISKSSLLTLRAYYKEDATPFDDPLQLNKPGDLPGSSWIWGNGIEVSGKVFGTNFLAGINSSDQISYVRVKKSFAPLLAGFTAMGTNWGTANQGKSLFGVDVTGKLGPVDLKAEGIYGKCDWGTGSEGGMVLYADLSSQLNSLLKLYGTAKKVDLGYMHQFGWFKTDQTQLIPGTSGSAGTYVKIGAVVTPLSNLSIEPIVELTNREDITEKTTEITGIVTYNPTKQVNLKGTVYNENVNGTNSTSITGEVTLKPVKNTSIYGKLHQPLEDKTGYYANIILTPLNNMTLYSSISGGFVYDDTYNTLVYNPNVSFIFIKGDYKLARDVTLTGLYQNFKNNTEEHNTYYLALNFNNATLYYGKAPLNSDAVITEGIPVDFAKQIGAKISFDF